MGKLRQHSKNSGIFRRSLALVMAYCVLPGRKAMTVLMEMIPHPLNSPYSNRMWGEGSGSGPLGRNPGSGSSQACGLR